MSGARAAEYLNARPTSGSRSGGDNVVCAAKRPRSATRACGTLVLCARAHPRTITKVHASAIIRVFCVDGPCRGVQYLDEDSGRVIFGPARVAHLPDPHGETVTMDFGPCRRRTSCAPRLRLRRLRPAVQLPILADSGQMIMSLCRRDRRSTRRRTRHDHGGRVGSARPVMARTEQFESATVVLGAPCWWNGRRRRHRRSRRHGPSSDSPSTDARVLVTDPERVVLGPRLDAEPDDAVGHRHGATTVSTPSRRLTSVRRGRSPEDLQPDVEGRRSSRPPARSLISVAAPRRRRVCGEVSMLLAAADEARVARSASVSGRAAGGRWPGRWSGSTTARAASGSSSTPARATSVERVAARPDRQACAGSGVAARRAAPTVPRIEDRPAVVPSTGAGTSRGLGSLCTHAVG